jgi:hypothetical protein
MPELAIERKEKRRLIQSFGAGRVDVEKFLINRECLRTRRGSVAEFW